MKINKLTLELLNRMEKINCYEGMIEIETKLFGIEHTYVYYNIEDETMTYLDDIEALLVNDAKLKWFISNDEIIEYMQEISQR